MTSYVTYVSSSSQSTWISVVCGVFGFLKVRDSRNANFLCELHELEVFRTHLIDAMRVIRERKSSSFCKKRLLTTSADHCIRISRDSTNLANHCFGIGSVQAFSQSSGIEFNNPSIPGDVIKVSQYLLPNIFPSFKAGIWFTTFQPDQIEMPNHRRFQCL